MSDYAGVITSGISDQAGSGSRHTLAGRSTNVTGGLVLPATSFTGIQLSSPLVGTPQGLVTPTLPGTARTGTVAEGGPGENWFELMHTSPQFFELGNILATVTRDIEVYSSYREDDRLFDAATNNAGVGVVFLNLPSLPATIGPQDNLIFQVQVSTTGPPEIDGALDFEFDTEDLSVAITGTRVVIFPYEPETPIREVLEWLTTVLISINGKEQRVSIRKSPRQLLEFLFRVEEGRTRRKIQTLLHGWHPGVFGIPIWFEARYLDATAEIGDTTIYADTTYADFRTGSLVIVWKNDEVFDALEISSLTDSSLTLSSPITKQFLGGQVLVMPLRVGVTEENIDRQRYLVGLEDITLPFTILDNNVDLADTSAFPSYNGRVLLDEGNIVDGGTLPVSFERVLNRIDNGISSVLQTSDWPGPAFLTQKGFFCNSAKRKWEIRQLLHALRGQQVTFYLPTFYIDMVASGDVALGSPLLDIESIGYTDYIDGQSPSNHLQIVLVDGTVYWKEILSSEEISSTVERLTLGDNWDQDIAEAEFSKIGFLRLSRLATDRVTFVHNSAGEAQISTTVRQVSQ